MLVFWKTFRSYYINDSLWKHPWFVLDRVATLKTSLVYVKSELSIRKKSFMAWQFTKMNRGNLDMVREMQFETSRPGDQYTENIVKCPLSDLAYI